MRGWQLTIFTILVTSIWYWRLESGINFSLQSDQKVRIAGTVSQQPSVKQDKYTNEEYQWIWITVGSDIFGFRTDRWEQIDYGSRVEVVGKLRRLEKNSFENSPLSSLLPRRWMIKRDHNYELQVANNDDGNFLQNFRHQILNLFRRTLPRNEAGLLSGMVLGTKNELSTSFNQDLRNSGTIHVVVASGFNVMLVAGAMSGLMLLWFRKQVAVILGMLFIWGYVALVGFDAPVVRAGLMGSLAYLGIILGRVREAGWLLIISSSLMLWWKPTWLWDVGFQLSVVATAGLVWIEPRLHFSKEKKQNKFHQSNHTYFSKTHHNAIQFWQYLMKLPVFGESLRTTLAAQIAVLPILIGTFGKISLWSPIVNALVLWVVPIITGVGMAVGFLSTIFSFSFFQFFSSSVLWLIWPLLKFFVVIVQQFGKWGTFNLIMPWWVGVVYYLGLWWLIRKIKTS